MPVPVSISAIFRPRNSISLFAFLFIAISLLAARNPDPALRIPLEPLGFQQPSAQFLLAGSSMYTLHYVDDRHLLLTWSAHRLLKRLPNEPPDDQDRFVDAVLIEIPSGHVLARTQWRLHDHGQYLWSLGHGSFLLRIRDTLTTFSPVANLASGQPFRERAFLTTDRRIAAVILSPEYDLLILETMPPAHADPDAIALPSVSGAPRTLPVEQEHDPTPIQINVFRVFVSSALSDQIQFRDVGAARARTPGRIPAIAEGYLATIDQGRQHWAFDFNSYEGKTSELSPFDSSCRPAPVFVSGSEFIAFGCHGGNTFQVIGAFNMRGEEMWEQTVQDSYFAPSFVFAPSSGRFALSRILSRAQSDLLIPELVGGQSVVVIQTDSGRQILRADPLPVQRAGQNFTLSPDGMSLAILHGDCIEIYSLPPLTTKEQEAVKLARRAVPASTEAPIHFSSQMQDTSPTAESVSGNPTQTPSQAPSSQPAAVATPAPSNTAHNTTTNPSAAASQSTTSDTAAEDTQQPTQPRKPPTLYNSPSDPPPNQPTNQPQ
jgi:hypothetical protein